MKSLIVVFLFVVSAQLASAQLDFYQGTYEEAKAQASSEGKFLFLDFYADWCMPCKQMERYGFRDADFARMIRTHFIAYKVDVDMFVGMDVAENFKVSSYPTLIVADAKGKEKRRTVGYQSAEELKNLVKSYSK